MSKKYELVESSKIILKNVILYRIKALIDIPNIVKAGELGGYIESEKNLSHEGNCWVADDAQIYGNAQVCGDVYVSGDAKVYDDAVVLRNTQVSGHAKIYGNAKVSGHAKVYGNAKVFGNVKIYGNAVVTDNAAVYGDAIIVDNTQVSGNAKVWKDALILSNNDYTTISGFGRKNRTTTFYLSKNNIIMVDCGCFNGDITELRERVKATHGASSLGHEYEIIADLMEMRFNRVLLERAKYYEKINQK